MFAVIRIRGTVGVRKEIEDTLKMLRLKAVNNCVLLPETDSIKGMLQKVKDRVTWGRINKETLVRLLEKRLRFRNKQKVSLEQLKQMGFGSFEELAERLLAGDVQIKNLNELQPYFRLTPPSKGFKSIKHPFPKGDLGNRGDAINELLIRMI
jgi:large subunit ribosomal protein L30